MNTSRIASAIDVQRTQTSTVAVVGNAPMFTSDLVRSGVGHIILVDFDSVDSSNVARQDYDDVEVGGLKVEALRQRLLAINPHVLVTTLAVDFTTLTDAEMEQHFGDVDLLVLATDSFAAQARGNEVALRINKPALWIGLYEGGQVGEIVFWHPGLVTCLQCLLPGRYQAHANATRQGRSIDPASDATTIFDIHILDAIAGQIAIGLLTRGADNRFGRLIDQLGDRQFIQIKIDPDWTFNGRDIFREQLRIPSDCDPYFSWTAIARRDPDGGQLPCLDCEKYRGAVFEKIDGAYVRLNGPEDDTSIPVEAFG